MPVTSEALLRGRTAGAVHFELGPTAAALAGEEAASPKAALLVDFPETTWATLVRRLGLREGGAWKPAGWFACQLQLVSGGTGARHAALTGSLPLHTVLLAGLCTSAGWLL